MTLPVKPELTLEQAVRAHRAAIRLLGAREATYAAKPRRTGWDAAYVGDARRKHGRAERGVSKAKEQR